MALALGILLSCGLLLGAVPASAITNRDGLDLAPPAGSGSPHPSLGQAYSDDTPAGTNAGSAYVFVRTGTIWTEQAHLRAPDGAAFDRFGFSVAVSGDTAVVGAYYDDTSAGTDAGSAAVVWR